MKNQRKIRPNLTNYDVIEILEKELREAEKRIFKKTLLAVSGGVVCLILFITLFVHSNSTMIRDYAAEAMRKSFEAERAVHIIDEAAGTNFLEQAKGSN